LDETPKVKVEKVKMVLCSWAAAPFQGDEKCGWTGRADKYQAHLIARHGGKEYKEPKTGL